MVAIDIGIQGPDLDGLGLRFRQRRLGQAYRLVRYGEIDAALTGGRDAHDFEVRTAASTGWATMSQTDRSAATVRPNRDGLVIGEGAGMLVLESVEHAQARGARSRPSWPATARPADAYHMTDAAPRRRGRGAGHAHGAGGRRARRRKTSDYINAHGTSTPLNDAAETRPSRRSSASAPTRLPISSTKSMIGHMMGAAGAVESIFCVAGDPRQGSAADDQLRDARPGLRPGLRAQRGPAGAGAGLSQQRLRLRRPQRGRGDSGV